MTISSPGYSSGRFRPNPPAKGSFPFDKQGLCTELAERYMKCLKSNDNQVEPCREISREYLDCRMKNNLMAEDKWENLGFDQSSKEKQEN